MSDIDDDYITCSGDRYDHEPPCPECKGRGKRVYFQLLKECERCEGTGVDLEAAGYYDQAQTD